MKQHNRLITIISFAALAISPCITGCKNSTKQAATENPAAEFLPSTLGLPEGAERLGPDPMGRHWYHASAPKEQHWAYDPKTKTLYTATKDEKTGEWVLKEKPEVTPASLGLAADTMELGKDPNGVYWFALPGSEERLAYNTKNKTLYKARKNASGNWEIGELLKKP